MFAKVITNVMTDFGESLPIGSGKGYGGSRADAGKAIGKTGDEGIDGVIKEDRLGLGVIYVQAKRWEQVLGRPEVQKVHRGVGWPACDKRRLYHDLVVHERSAQIHFGAWDQGRFTGRT